MDNVKFTNLLRGPLAHPLPVFSITRLALALKYVVDRCGDAGEQALDEYCVGRELRDHIEEVDPR